MKRIIFPLIITCLFVKINAQILPENYSDNELTPVQTYISELYTGYDAHSYQIFNETETGFLTSSGNLPSNNLFNSNTYRSVYEGYLDYTSQRFGFYCRGGYPGVYFKLMSGDYENHESQSYNLSVAVGLNYQQMNWSSMDSANMPFKTINNYDKWYWIVGDLMLMYLEDLNRPNYIR